MASLRSALPALAEILGETEGTLYERQRSLVRERLLKAVPGKGPGAGVQVTPESVAMLLIGALASANLVDAAPRARALAKATGKCALSGEGRFIDALAAILADGSLAARVNEIVVGLTECQAIIRHGGAKWQEGPPKMERTGESSIFIGERGKHRGLRFTVSLGGDSIEAISKLVAEISA